LDQNPYFADFVLIEADMSEILEIVKKYLRFSGRIGKPKGNNFKIEFTGKIRKNELSDWMPFKS